MHTHCYLKNLNHWCLRLQDHYNKHLLCTQSFTFDCIYYVCVYVYRIRGLFGDDFNLAVWQITSESPNLSHAILKVTF